MFDVTVPMQPISAPAAMRENPYLQPLAAPGFVTLPSNVKSKLEPLPPPRTANLPSFSPPTPIPPPQSKVPEFARPLADEKYFKPLKRF